MTDLPWASTAHRGVVWLVVPLGQKPGGTTAALVCSAVSRPAFGKRRSQSLPVYSCTRRGAESSGPPASGGPRRGTLAAARSWYDAVHQLHALQFVLQLAVSHAHTPQRRAELVVSPALRHIGHRAFHALIRHTHLLLGLVGVRLRASSARVGGARQVAALAVCAAAWHGVCLWRPACARARRSSPTASQLRATGGSRV